MNLVQLVIGLGFFMVINLQISAGHVDSRGWHKPKPGIKPKCSKEGLCRWANSFERSCCCQLRDGGVPKCNKKGEWTCDIKVRAKKSIVCASDGKTYSHESKVALESCRANKPLTIVNKGKCRETMTTTTTTTEPPATTSRPESPGGPGNPPESPGPGNPPDSPGPESPPESPPPEF